MTQEMASNPGPYPKGSAPLHRKMIYLHYLCGIRCIQATCKRSNSMSIAQLLFSDRQASLHRRRQRPSNSHLQRNCSPVQHMVQQQCGECLLVP